MWYGDKIDSIFSKIDKTHILLKFLVCVSGNICYSSAATFEPPPPWAVEQELHKKFEYAV